MGPSFRHLAAPDPRPVDRAAAPEAAARLSSLFRANRAWLLALLRLRRPAEAEDLLQETFLRAARRWDPEAVRHPRAWLAAIALNVAREHRRRQACRAPASEVDGAVEYVDSPAPPDQDEALLLKQVILALPPKFRDVFVLHRFEGLTYPEIARRLKISTKTVEWRMSRALEICASRLRD